MTMRFISIITFPGPRRKEVWSVTIPVVEALLGIGLAPVGIGLRRGMPTLERMSRSPWGP
jgi:hypothetical protein